METHFGLHTLDGEWYALLPRYASLAQALVGRRVLEVGCGRGVGTALLHQAGVEKIAAIDHRPEHIQDAQARFDELDDETFNVMRYDDMEYEDALFDVIICLDTNFPSTDKLFLAEVQRLLAPGGVFVAAFEVHEAYGLDKVLPRSGDAVEVAMTHMAASGAQRLLTERFGHTQTLAQIPELSFTFATDHEEPQNWRQEALGLANKPVADSGAILVLSSTQELAEDEPLLRSTRVHLPHDAIVARLGRIQNDFFLQGEEAEQRLLVADELGEERLELINDLEEEVRSQRELVSDQTAQIDDFKEQLTAISQIPDLTSDFARAQAELATRKQETLELTADFNRRVQDLTWALEERDARLNELAQTNRQWEQYSQGLEQDLAARELALENLGKVLARFEGTQAPEAKPEPPPEAPAPQQTAQAPKPDEHQAQELRKALAINAALESEGQALRQQLADMRAHLKSAQQEALRAQESHHRLQAELHSRANYAAEVERRAEAQDTQAKAFAQEVAGVYEEANTLKKSLEKAQEKIKSLDEKATKKADVSVNLERELYQKGQELLRLKRELMGKNVEVSGLERENVRLLKVKADADKAIDAERASVKTLEERLNALGALLDQARAEAKDNAVKLSEAHKKAADAAKAQQKAQAALKKAQEEASKAPAKAPKALASTPTKPKAPTEAANASQDADKAKAADASSPADKPKAGGASSPSVPQAAPSSPGGSSTAPPENHPPKSTTKAQKQGGASSPGDPSKANNTNTEAPAKGVQLSLDVDTPPAETKTPAKKPRRAKPAPKTATTAKPKKANKAPKKAKADPKASKDGRPNEDDLKEAGFKLEGKGFWVSKDAVFVGTSRYWARVTLKPSKRVRVEGGAAKTTTVQLSKLVDVLTERFNVSERGARRLAQHLKTTGLGHP